MRRRAESRGLGHACFTFSPRYLGAAMFFCWFLLGCWVAFFPCLFGCHSTQVFCESMQELFTYKRIYDRQGFVLDRLWRKKNFGVVDCSTGDYYDLSDISSIANLGLEHFYAAFRLRVRLLLEPFNWIWSPSPKTAVLGWKLPPPFSCYNMGLPLKLKLVNESNEMFVTRPRMETLRRMLPIAPGYLTARPLPALRLKVLWMLPTVTRTWRN